MPEKTYYARHRERLLAAAKARRLEDPEWRAKTNAKAAEWREENRERFQKMQKDWEKDNPFYYFLNNARARAKQQNVPYELNVPYLRTLPIPEVCPYLGIPIQVNTGGHSSENSPSLDKIIPHLGYVPGNVEFISSRANRLKNDSSIEELEAITMRLRRLVDERKA